MCISFSRIGQPNVSADTDISANTDTIPKQYQLLTVDY